MARASAEPVVTPARSSLAVMRRASTGRPKRRDSCGRCRHLGLVARRCGRRGGRPWAAGTWMSSRHAHGSPPLSPTARSRTTATRAAAARRQRPVAEALRRATRGVVLLGVRARRRPRRVRGMASPRVPCPATSLTPSSASCVAGCALGWAADVAAHEPQLAQAAGLHQRRRLTPGVDHTVGEHVAPLRATEVRVRALSDSGTRPSYTTMRGVGHAGVVAHPPQLLLAEPLSTVRLHHDVQCQESGRRIGRVCVDVVGEQIERRA
jgi:hypothetical protein